MNSDYNIVLELVYIISQQLIQVLSIMLKNILSDCTLFKTSPPKYTLGIPKYFSIVKKSSGF